MGESPPTSMLETIGRTPIVRLKRMVPEGAAEVWVKLEWFNPTGSYKDRMALAMIEEAEKRGDLRPGMTVVEYTGGSTGSSLAFVCAVKGYRFAVVSSDAFSEVKLSTMRAFGADLTLVPSRGGQITPDLIPSMIDAAARIAQQSDSYQTDQFNNRDSLVGYGGIGMELSHQLGRFDLFCGAVGTAGMLMGVASKVRATGTEIVALEPATTAVLGGGAAGAHHVEGIGVGFVPPLYDPSLVDRVVAVDEGRARETARRLACEEGLFAGTSSGLNITAAIDLAVELGSGRRVVTVAVDTGLKYVGGDLYG
jgi:cysteine synthase